MNISIVLDKEAILCEKEPLDLSNIDHQMEIIEIEKFMQKSNIQLEQLQEAFELNRRGKLADYLFERGSKKVIAYQKIGLRYVSEIIFGYREYKRINRGIEKPLELPPPPPMTIEESYEACKKVVINKYIGGQTNYFQLASYLLEDFYELDRDNIEMTLDDQKREFEMAKSYLTEYRKNLNASKGNLLSLKEAIEIEISTKDAYSLAKRKVLAKYIIETYLIEQL